MAGGAAGLSIPPLLMVEIAPEAGCVVRMHGDTVRSVSMCRSGAVWEVRMQLRCMIVWRDASGGEAAHFACRWADDEGGWWESDGLLREGAARRIASPSGEATARAGGFFPVAMIYETGV